MEIRAADSRHGVPKRDRDQRAPDAISLAERSEQAKR